MRAALLFSIATVASACGSADPCAGLGGTCVTLTVTSARIAQVDAIDISASGAVTGTQSSAAKGSQQLPVKVALRFPATASGAIHLDVDGRQTGSIVGVGSTDGSVAAGKHSSMTVDLEPTTDVGGDDMAVTDDGGQSNDLSGMQPGPDLAMNPDTPRLLSPLSTSMVTSKRPVLKWTIPSGVGTPSVDICSDPACATTIATATITGSQAVPTTDLPYGPVFWRVRSTLGANTSYSATWEFFVPSHAVSTSINIGVGSVFDANMDGLADVIIGEPQYPVSGQRVGRVFVLMNSAANGLPTSLPTPIESKDGANGGWGLTVSSADVNGDGYADMIAGAPHGSGVPGVVYVFFGSASGLNLNSPQTITSPLSTVGGLFGISVSGAGDVNGDGYGDVIVGESQAQVGGASNAGRFYVFYGSAGGLQTTAGSYTSVDGFDGANAGLGWPVLGGGDVDGDGYGDVLVAAQNALDGANNQVGRVYVYRGSSNGLVKSAPFATTQGPVAMGRFGWSIAFADLNNDGYSDVAVGAFGENSNAGTVYVYQSTGSGLGTATTISDPNGASAEFGTGLANGGDVNGDGYPDLLVGSPQPTGGSSPPPGVVDIYLGSATGVTTTSPIVINGNSAGIAAGTVLSAAGDITNDGYADILIGAPAYSSASGEVFLQEGQSGGVKAAATRTWTGNPVGNLGKALY